MTSTAGGFGVFIPVIIVIMLIVVGILLLSGIWTQFVYWLRDFAVSDTTLPI